MGKWFNKIDKNYWELNDFYIWGGDDVNRYKKEVTQGRSFTLINISVFLISLSLFMYEVLLTRLFSVMLNYNFVFMVISFAILGNGVGSILVYKYLNSNNKLSIDDLLLKYSFLFSISIIFSILLMYFMPYIPIFVVYSMIGAIPFVFGGALISIIIKEKANESGKLYFIDLFGGAIGSLLILKLMNNFGFMTSLFITGIFSFSMVAIIHYYYNSKKKTIGFSIIIGILFLIIIQGSVIKFIEKGFYSYYTNPNTVLNILKKTESKPTGISFTKWDSISRTDVIDTTDPREKIIVTDGGAAAPIIRFDGNIKTIEYLKGEVNYIPFYFGDNDKTLVIGSGGGKDVLFALLGKSKKIDAVEINTSTIEAVNKFKEFNGNIYNINGVKIYNEDGRNFIERSKEKYDNIYLSMVMTNAIENNKYALSENYIFTKEAFKKYFEHLETNGKLSVMVHSGMDLLKVVNTGISVLLDNGVKQEDVTDYFVIINGVAKDKPSHMGKIEMPLVIFKNVPFTESEISKIRRIANEQNRDIIHIKGSEFYLYKDFKDKTITFNELLNSVPFNSKPIKDDSPFFYNYSKFVPLEMIGLLISILSIWSFIKKKYFSNKEHYALSKYFITLGIAYMFVEIPLIQKMVLFIGNPSLTFSIVLSTLLISSGIGSRLSEVSFIKKLISKSSSYLIITGILILALQLNMKTIFRLASDLPMNYKIIITILTILPVGLFMGIPFPTGIRKLSEGKKNGKLIPLMWGVNGLFSVIGSVLAVIIAMMFGFNITLFLGSALYVLLFIINPFNNLKDNISWFWRRCRYG